MTYNDAQSDGTACSWEYWEKCGEGLGTLRMQKAVEKSKEFLIIIKRSGCGWSAYYALNKWYSSISGHGMSTKMQSLMRPPQAKRDEEVMYDVEQRRDELRECRALGASEMGPLGEPLENFRTSDDQYQPLDFDFESVAMRGAFPSSSFLVRENCARNRNSLACFG